MTATLIADPFAAREQARARLETAKAEAEVKLLERFVEAVAGDLRESTWDPVGRFDDDPEESAALPRWGVRRRMSQTSVRDRTDGRFLPFYESEWDLRRTRAQGRMLAAFSSVAVGAIETLGKYVVGTGLTFKAQPRPGVNAEAVKEVVAGVQRFIDRFVDANRITGQLDLETHQYAREDGERFLALHPAFADVPRIEVLEPEQVTEPTTAGKRGLNRWGGPRDDVYWDDDGRNRWEFGVHTRADEATGRHDPSRPIGYHVVYGEAGDDWDYLEADRVQHFKRNAPLHAKRGVTDFFPVLEDGDGEGRLNRNIREGMAILACIPFVKEYAADKVPSKDAAGADIYSAVRSAGGGGVRTARVQTFRPGQIPEVKGAKYQPGPLSQMRGDAVIEVAKSVIRRMGTRWSLPAFMLTGDVESGLYTSVLAVGSPFVKAREQDQAWFGENWVRLIWKAVALHARQGRFRWTLEQIQEVVEIDWEGPAIALTTEQERANRQKVEIDAGILSRQTACEEAGRDWKKELARGAAPGAVPTLGPAPSPAGASPANPAPQGGTPETLTTDPTNALNGAQIAAAIQVLSGVVDRTVAPGVAAELLTSLGLDPQRAAAMVRDQVTKAKPAGQPAGTSDPRLARAMEAKTPEEARAILFEGYP